VTRDVPVLVAALLNAAVLTGFVLLWGDGAGVPNLAGQDFHEQGQLVELGLLTLILPWAAVRCMAPERGADLVLLSAMTALRPSVVMTARLVGLTGGLLMIVAAGVPATLVMLRMAALDASHLPQTLTAPLVVTACAAAWGAWAGHRVPGRVAAWCAAGVLTGLTIVVTYGLLPGAVARALTVASGLVAAGLLITGADREYRTLSLEAR